MNDPKILKVSPTMERVWTQAYMAYLRKEIQHLKQTHDESVRYLTACNNDLEEEIRHLQQRRKDMHSQGMAQNPKGIL